MKHRIKILLLAVLIAALCNCMLMIGMTKTKEKNTIPKDASLICEETVSPNKDYITDEKDLVNYTVRVYQEKNNDIIVYAESNSPLFDEAQYINMRPRYHRRRCPYQMDNPHGQHRSERER